MSHIEKNQENIQNNIQAEIDFEKNMRTLFANLSGIDKSLVNKGYGYKYQNFNEIVREIKNVIKKHNLELRFAQHPVFTVVEGQVIHVIRTTFYSTSSSGRYKESFDTPIHIDGSKNNSIPQQFGSAITYFKRYALVAALGIESEVDTDADPNYNNYENENYVSNRQVSFNRKQEQKQEINYNQKKTIIQNNKTTP
ncbi:ERF family protein, partial [Borreliella bavariensis]|uniref:ERF family protein n=1 Tax=Borreliella bavariensis TaxID=664662 RepID=UPI001BFFDEF4